MSTQYITIDSAPFISSPGSETARPTPASSSSDRHRLEHSDFFKGKSMTELAREQGVGPVMDIRVFAGGIPDNEDVDKLLAQLEELRSS